MDNGTTPREISRGVWRRIVMYPAAISPSNEFLPVLVKPIIVPKKVANINDETITFRLLSQPMNNAQA